jgi:hypothetical protein
MACAICDLKLAKYHVLLWPSFMTGRTVVSSVEIVGLVDDVLDLSPNPLRNMAEHLRQLAHYVLSGQPVPDHAEEQRAIEHDVEYLEQLATQLEAPRQHALEGFGQFGFQMRYRIAFLLQAFILSKSLRSQASLRNVLENAVKLALPRCVSQAFVDMLKAKKVSVPRMASAPLLFQAFSTTNHPHPISCPPSPLPTASVNTWTSSPLVLAFLIDAPRQAVWHSSFLGGSLGTECICVVPILFRVGCCLHDLHAALVCRPMREYGQTAAHLHDGGQLPDIRFRLGKYDFLHHRCGRYRGSV